MIAVSFAIVIVDCAPGSQNCAAFSTPSPRFRESTAGPRVACTSTTTAALLVETKLQVTLMSNGSITETQLPYGAVSDKKEVELHIFPICGTALIEKVHGLLPPHFLGISSKRLGVCGWILFSLSLLLMIITFPISIWMCLKIIKEYERAVVFRLGRIQADKARGPGLILVLPCIDVFVKVDLRTVTCNIPPQEILTRDSVTTQVDGVVYYRIYSAVSAVANVNDVHQATFLLAQTTLRNVLGTQTLSQILAGREEIAHSIQTLLDDATELWGIRVARVEIKDVRIPVQLQRSMAAEAEATREARARVLAAEGEMNASKSLKSASMVLAESPIALQLRYLQTLTTVATEKNSTIVFPLPMNILEGIGGVSYNNHGKVQNRA
ncbi:stomatin-like protein 3 [Ailuropoda melanoleuca]|nr:stomatin-like protein 3 [Ailuropoda melanoleuca]